MKVRILVVDDDKDVLSMLSRHFRYAGFEVQTAANGEEALQILAELKIDIVISDIIMPVMNGIEMLRTIKAEYPMIRVIMISGRVSLDNALACMRLGADIFVGKPLEDLSELDQAVKVAVESVKGWLEILGDLKYLAPEKCKG